MTQNLSVSVSVSVSVSGATGTLASHINGIWNRSREVFWGQSVYFKVTDLIIALNILPNESMDYDTGGAKGAGAGLAFVHCAAGVPLEDCSNNWVVGDNGRR